MCGIAVLAVREPDRNLSRELNSMVSVIKHRGPDDEGYLFGDFRTGSFYSAGGNDTIRELKPLYEDVSRAYDKPFTIGLGHRRLSIIDPSPLGHQPMTSRFGDNWIVFNGEIYNFREIRKELETLGHRFESQSDTEVLLNGYHEYGEDIVQRLNGIFAFAVWDTRKQKLFLARDHFGVKPLYYHLDPVRLIIASEIKAIVQIKGISRVLDKESLDDYLTFRYTPSPNTLLLGIKKLRPGHSLSMDLAKWRMEIRRYHQVIPQIIKGRPKRNWVEDYSSSLTKAVRRQLIADVPLGLLLSGGVDSGLVTAIATSMSSKPLKTYTVGYEEESVDNELRAARRTATLFKTDHHEVIVSAKDYFEFLESAGWFMDEPVGSSSLIAMYFVCKYASRDVKTVLTGQGADEPLAGYARYKGEKYHQLLRLLATNKPLRLLAASLPRNEQLKRAFRSLGERDWKRRFVCIYSLFDEAQRRALLKQEFWVEPKRATDYLDYWAVGLDHLDSLSRMLYIDTRMWLPDDLLTYGDKMSMAASLEARVPFLDVDLVNLIETMPPSLKLKGWNRGKYVHKLAARQWLPPDILRRPKKGFPTPLDQWFQKELAGEISVILLSSSSLCAQYFSLPYIRSLIEKHKAGREDHQRQLFALLFFEFWAKRFLS
jgi:asparagine synthase (glutamine-hydrolysing)